MTPSLPYTKEQQLHKKRWKPTQKQKGDISTKVDRELKERSNGVCELHLKCNGAKATERAHTMGRRIIPHKTTVNDLFHVCTECHVWFDQTVEGIRFRRQVREIGTSAYLKDR
jgi:hypothetical protein